MKPTASAAELYVHAIAIEREAALRYAGFAERMGELGNHAVAALFRLLSVAESRHLDALQRRTEGVRLPELGSDYSWRAQGEAPETVPRELVFRTMTAREALLLALRAEKRAHAFFDHAMRIADDPAVRALAREMAAEEDVHIGLVERMLQRTADERADWAAVLEGR